MSRGIDLGDIQVLLIEDNPRDARLVQLMLGEFGGNAARGGGFVVTEVSRCQSALDLLGDGKRFDVVLLDLQLPDAHGLQALAQLRAGWPTLPIVILTGLDDDVLALAAIRQGAQDWLSKEDLAGRRLARALRHAIQRKKNEAELFYRSRHMEEARTLIERRAAELDARVQQLDAVNRSLDEFTYIASHELKEPLFGIRAYCEILLEDHEDQITPEGARRLRALIEMCDRQADQIDHLLTFCRIGCAENPRNEIPLDELVRNQLDVLQPMIDRHRAVVEILDPLPVVLGDASLVATVLANLISNGLKYNQSQVPRVEIGAVAGEPGAFFVRDNGIGIEPRHHEEIFTLFRRLHSRDEYEGTGAGLTIVLRIVQRLGGRIWLESEPGLGSTFYVALPPADRPEPAATKPPHWLSCTATSAPH